MNWTNKHNIPKHICNWLKADDYDYIPGTISATTLIGPARAWALKQQFSESLERDYSDMIKSRLGTAIHDSLEKAAAFGEYTAEERFFADFMSFRISGKMDAIVDGVIRDIKTTGVWKIVKSDFCDYVKQLSIYKWLLDKNGITTADYGMIDFFFNDWKRADSLRGGDYPSIPYREQRIELWPVDQTEAYIAERLEEFVFAKSLLPRCTREELWQSETTYAYYAKEGAAKATKIYPESEQGEAELRVAESGGVVVARPGKAKRCSYCDAAPFCNQYRELLATGAADELD